jgi:protein SCO1/2
MPSTGSCISGGVWTVAFAVLVLSCGAFAAEENKAIISKASIPATKSRRHLLDCTFTNEMGQPVKLRDFHGQALAITFIFTRCPSPNFCPRLSRNFQEASQKLLAKSDAPTNWHFLSVTFDPEFDTPAVLKAYAERYQYDPRHWTFLTGPVKELAELATNSNVKFERDGGLINHDFRTLIIDARGELQMVFPTSGDLSDAIAREMLKAVTVTNRPPEQP